MIFTLKVMFLLSACLPQAKVPVESELSTQCVVEIRQWSARVNTKPKDLAVRKADNFWTTNLPRFDSKQPSGHLPQIYARHRRRGGTPEQFQNALRPWIQNFGQDCYYDLRLSLELCDFFSPINSTHQKQWSEKISFEEELSEMIAELQVRDWLSDHSKLERIVWFTVWSQSQDTDRREISWFTGFEITDSAAIRKQGEYGAWWDTRKFLYLCMLTNQMERVRQTTPKNVSSKYADWKDTIERAAKQGRMRPSGFSPTLVLKSEGDSTFQNQANSSVPWLKVLPHVPFPEFENFPALSPRMFRELN